MRRVRTSFLREEDRSVVLALAQLEELAELDEELVENSSVREDIHSLGELVQRVDAYLVVA